MGDLHAKIPASAHAAVPGRIYNAMLDAIDYVEQIKHRTGGAQSRSMREAGLVLVKNRTSDDVDRFGVLGIGAVWPSLADNPTAWKSLDIAFDGEKPLKEHLGKFAIPWEPIPAGAIGLACLHGLSPAKLTATTANHPYADIAPGNIASLAPDHRGSAFLLETEGSGNQWGLVLLGGWHSDILEGSLATELPTSTEVGATMNVSGSESITLWPSHVQTATVPAGKAVLARWDRPTYRWVLAGRAC
jgi:hypothetical protein